MRSAVVFAFAAGALAIPHKRDVVTQIDYVYETDVVTIWAGAEPSSSVAVAPVAAEPTSASSPAPAVGHYGHNHFSQGGWSRSQSPTPESSTPSSTYVAPTTTSTSAPPPPPPAPTTTSTSTPAPPPPPPTSYVAPTTSSVWVAPSSAPAPAPAPAPASSADLSKPSGYNQLVVYHHNIHRRNHSAPDLEWSDDLAASAQAVASSCVYGHNVDANGGGYGQNIAAGVEPANISAIITGLFYNGEVNWYEGLYNQAQPDMSNFDKWGHFSQIVWKDTTHVGCATQHCGKLENVGKDVVPYFTVCNYKNPGNFADQYGKNIGVSLKHKTVEWNDGM